jgi:ADP-ribose pyrophosphatase YjhB (NUDIX family)
MKLPRWLEWAREIQALAQTGSYYALNDYQRQRYQRLKEIAVEIVSEHTKLNYESVLKVFETPVGYSTPRVDVRGAVFRENKLLLVRERTDNGWTFPGGWADVGELPSQAVEREVWEESGFMVKAEKVIGIYDANRFGQLELFHAYKIVFLCDLISGAAQSSNETSEVAFFTEAEIPQALSGERTSLRHIRDAFNSIKEPAYSTVFD